MDINNMTVRAASGIVYIGLIVGATFAGQPWFSILICLFSVLATIEFGKIVRGLSRKTAVVTGIDVIVNACMACTFLAPMPCLFATFPLVLVRMIYTIFDRGEHPFRSLAYSVLSYLYIGLPLFLLLCIRHEGITPVLMLFCALWINDTGAYLVGSLIGKHRLCERISPKKSWEGFFGGLLFNIIAAVVASHILTMSHPFNAEMYSMPMMLGLAIVLTVFATWGDLLESLLKRSMNIKDSGNIIPGHGGILDRIDSLLLTAPIMWMYSTAWYFLSL